MTTDPGPRAHAVRRAAGAGPPRGSARWYVAEHQLRGMRSYGWTIVMTAASATRCCTCSGIGLGLAAFLDQPIASGADGPVRYVWFVAPALLATAAVTVSIDEFTYTSWPGSSGAGSSGA